jgi:hypothetical protein
MKKYVVDWSEKDFMTLPASSRLIAIRGRWANMTSRQPNWESSHFRDRFTRTLLRLPRFEG